MDYEIDPVSAASPDMDEADFAALKQSIAEIGQLVAIVTVGGTIIDGRKRYRACQELGKEPSIIEIPIGADPGVHAVALNILRTHYTASQRAMYAAVAATRPHGDQGARSPTSVIVQVPTIREAAKAAGVAHSMVIDAKAVRREGIPEVVAAVERGDLTVHGAKRITAQPKAEQGAALQSALARPKGRDGRRVGRPAVSPELRRRVQRPRVEQFDRTVSHMETHIESLLELRYAVPNEDYTDWIKRLRSIRAGLSKVITALERT